MLNGRGRTAGEAGEYRLATMQSRIARLKGELGGRGLELEEGFEEGGGYVEMREFILPSPSVLLLIRLG